MLRRGAGGAGEPGRGEEPGPGSLGLWGACEEEGVLGILGDLGGSGGLGCFGVLAGLGGLGQENIQNI